MMRAISEKNEVDVQDFVADFHDQYRYRKDYSRYYYDYINNKMLSFVSVEGRILDNGCGTGILLETLGERGVVVGFDISFNMLKHARRGSDLIVLGDSQILPFQDGCFELVIGRSLLHHLPDPLKGVEEMARVLKTNGEMIVVDTNHSLLSAVPRHFAKKGKHFSDEHKNMRIKELTQIIEESFIVEHVYYFGYLAYPLSFPDIIDIGRYLPWPVKVTKLLTKLDSAISGLPIVRKQSWGVMIKGTKR
jgi:ubiquinone/menaquinone biosynthesis C-methylase UbiE